MCYTYTYMYTCKYIFTQICDTYHDSCVCIYDSTYIYVLHILYIFWLRMNHMYTTCMYYAYKNVYMHVHNSL